MSSDSDLSSMVQSLIMGNYASVFIVTAISYDYLLNISREVEYVWCKPWTWVSTIYVVVRYIGFSWVILNGLYTGGYISVATYLLALWEFPIFLYASDLVMILRVYALWQQSKTILYVLLVIYIPQVIVNFVLLGVYNNPNTDFSAQSSQFMDFHGCIITFNNIPPNVGLYDAIPRFVLAAILLALAVGKSLQESFSMYKATRRWQPNRYIGQFARDGIIYFLVNVLLDIVTLLPGGDNAQLFVTSLCYVAIGPMMPRFIISVREMYGADAKGRVGMDTGFGVVSNPTGDTDTMIMSAMAFADVPGPEGAEGQGRASMEDPEKQTRQRDLGPADTSEGIQEVMINSTPNQV